MKRKRKYCGLRNASGRASSGKLSSDEVHPPKALKVVQCTDLRNLQSYFSYGLGFAEEFRLGPLIVLLDWTASIRRSNSQSITTAASSYISVMAAKKPQSVSLDAMLKEGQEPLQCKACAEVSSLTFCRH